MADQARKGTAEGLKELLWKVYELEQTVTNLSETSQPVLEERLLALLSGVKELTKNTWAFQDLVIPVELLKYLDDGGNLDRYTVNAFNACARDNQAIKGKAQALQQLRDDLVEQLAQDLPQATAVYKSLLNPSKANAEAPPGASSKG